eukprot:scaffold5449_cov52-Cyclotella_meneghiniana.AAC.2
MEPPLRSHPIPVNMSGPGVFWTHRPARLKEISQIEIPVTVTLDEIGDDVQEMDLISDAAVHVGEGKGGVCWGAINANDNVYIERFPIEVPKDSYSDRQEMIGLFHALERALRRFPALEMIRCNCDNQAGIYKAQCPTYGPGEVTGSDIDVILAIRELVASQEE